MAHAQEESDCLIRDYPKPIVVVGVWMIYLPFFIANAIALLPSVFFLFTHSRGLFAFIGTACGTLLSGYMLYRSLKNYRIHRDRMLREIAEENRNAILTFLVSS